MSGKIVTDPAIKSLDKINKELRSLDDKARARVLAWMWGEWYASAPVQQNLFPKEQV